MPAALCRFILLPAFQLWSATGQYATSVGTLAGGLGGTSGGSGNGLGTAATFNIVVGVALPQSAAFALVADSGNNLVRYINLTTTLVSTLAGTASFGYADGVRAAATFFTPVGVALDAAGDIALVVSASMTYRAKVVQCTPSHLDTAPCTGRPQLSPRPTNHRVQRTCLDARWDSTGGRSC